MSFYIGKSYPPYFPDLPVSCSVGTVRTAGCTGSYSRAIPFPVAARSKLCVCVHSTVGIAGSNPAWVMNGSECSVLSDSGLCVEMITRPEIVLPSVVCLSVNVKPY